MTGRRPFRLSLVGLCLLAALITAPAAAYWTSLATGSGSASTATMPAGNQPSGSVSAQSVTVSWTQNSFLGSPLASFGGGGYNVLRYASAGSTPITPNASCAATIGSAAQCIEASVPYGAWRYSITPVLNDFTGAESAKSATVTVATAAPSVTAAPQNPTVGQTTGNINLSWPSVTGATGYNVYRGATLGSIDFGAPVSSSTALTYVDTTPVAATTYVYVVRATAGSPAVESANGSVSSTAITRPAAPTGVTATATAAAHVSVAWASVPGAAGYNVYRRTGAGAFDTVPLNGTLVLTTSYDDTGVNASSYTYLVRAVIIGAGSAQVESANSALSATVTADGSAAPAAATFLVTSGGNVKVGTSCSVTAGTQFINNSLKSSVGVTVTITAAPETGETFVFTATSPGSPTFTTTVPASGTSVSTTLDLSSVLLLNGVVTLNVQTKDVAGNLSAIKAPSNAIIKDTVAPTTASAVFHLLGSAPLGAGAHIDGTSECGALVSAQKVSGGGISTDTAAANGSYDIGLGVLALATFNVWSTDLAGNVGTAITT
ncbi:MAG: hypothetical protein QOI73_2432 [Solirubrobacteraceae bacterium]|nr:hypothetical protein [Solirubrobacteraceae bacterium]